MNAAALHQETMIFDGSHGKALVFCCLIQIAVG